MSRTECLRLLVLFFWLLVGDVNCENTQKAQALMGVHNDNRGYKRLREPYIYRMPTARHKTPSGNLYPAQEDRTTDSTSSQVQSHYSYPVITERQKSNVPQSQVSHLKSSFFLPSITRQTNNVVYHRSGNKAFPDDKKIQQANPDSVLAAGPVLVLPRIYAANKGMSPPQIKKGLGPSTSSKVRPNIQDLMSALKSLARKVHVNPSRTILHQRLHPLTRPHGRANFFQNVFKPIDEKTNSIVYGISPGSNSAGKVLTWSPRVYSSDVMSEARGYTHVRRFKPGFDKTQPSK